MLLCLSFKVQYILVQSPDLMSVKREAKNTNDSLTDKCVTKVANTAAKMCK
jgi:hypothetical protein